MNAFGRAILAICLFASATALGAPAPRSLETVLSRLKQGGAVILMRHAHSPSGQAAAFGMTEGCILQTGRGLDAKGFFQARFIGEFLKAEVVPIGAAYTSDLCRAWDTARLVAAGLPVTPVLALKTTNAADIDAFKMYVGTYLAANPDQNVLLVTHSNIVPLYADWDTDSEIPSGVILIVDPKTWEIRDKLNLDFDLKLGD